MAGAPGPGDEEYAVRDDQRPEVHLRMLTSEDAGWLVDVDQRTASRVAPPLEWEQGKLAAKLDEGVWASEDQWGWAVMVDGEPAGFALVTDIASGNAQVEIRVTADEQGRGVGREVLRQLADHHFAASEALTRLTGRAHEDNVPMQRAFSAAGFHMEARYRDAVRQPDGHYAAEWGYALTRQDWKAGHHRRGEGYNLHGLTFVVEEVLEGPAEPAADLLVKFLQEGRRALASYAGGPITEGELAGVLNGDVLTYHYIQDVDDEDGHRVVTGSGHARLQRRQDGRLEVVDQWSDDTGRAGTISLLERR